jgi:hypothetical protein
MARKKPRQSAEETIRRVTRKKHTADDKIRIVLEGLRGPCQKPLEIKVEACYVCHF